MLRWWSFWVKKFEWLADFIFWTRYINRSSIIWSVNIVHLNLMVKECLSQIFELCGKIFWVNTEWFQKYPAHTTLTILRHFSHFNSLKIKMFEIWKLFAESCKFNFSLWKVSYNIRMKRKSNERGQRNDKQLFLPMDIKSILNSLLLKLFKI